MYHEGSRWHRWDPHIHVPGTLFNDQYRETFDEFLIRLEALPPEVVALGVTDYFVLDSYELILTAKRAGRLDNIQLLFPNVELRAGTRLQKGNALNLHLIVSPDDPDHVRLTRESLGRLSFGDGASKVFCTNADLKRLGQRYVNSTTSNDAEVYARKCLEAGAQNFKPSIESITGWFSDEAWLTKNAFLVVAGGEDGIGGLREPNGSDGSKNRSGWFAQADNILSSVDFVFSASPSDRAHFISDAVFAKHGRRVACLHGSDAHDESRVCEPPMQRYCWIKGAPTFDTLRQVIAEPESRVEIAATPPSMPLPNATIKSVRIEKSGSWFESQEIPLNPNLTAVIGPRGSGKTALVDLIAAACGAYEPGDSSFLDRAGDSLPGTRVAVTWADGRESEWCVGGPAHEGRAEVQYLSQHFVSRLCDPDPSRVYDQEGDPLQEEIARVIFDSLSPADRGNASSFDELRATYFEHLNAEQRYVEEAIQQANLRVAEIDEQHRKLPDMQRQRDSAVVRRDALAKSIDTSLREIPKDDLDAHTKLQQRVQVLTDQVRVARARRDRAKQAKTKYDALRRQVSSEIAGITSLLREAGVAEHDFGSYGTELPDAGTSFDALIKKLGDDEVRIAGVADSPAEGTLAHAQKQLDASTEKLAMNTKRIAEFKTRDNDLSRVKAEIAGLEDSITKTTEAKTLERPNQVAERKIQLRRLVGIYGETAQAMRSFFRPLQDRIDLLARPDEKKLSVAVAVEFDWASWIARGESLFDLRTFSGTDGGAVAIQRACTSSKIREAWTSLDPDAVDVAMATLVNAVTGWLQAGTKRRAGVTNVDIVSWLYSVEHLHLTFSLRFDGADLSKLSPGTRGIVLLILYLALDTHDYRPLLIDQPEENLDNQSVYDLLVRYFETCKHRRQVIMVTHNPNLVINTDSELIVVADFSRSDSGEPQIRYVSGPIENTGTHKDPTGADRTIKERACRVLEGGREAFAARDARYRSTSAEAVTRRVR